MTKAYLAITLRINETNRAKAANVYNRYKAPFLEGIKGATSKELLVRTEDIQVLHGFEAVTDAQAYLGSELFTNDVVVALQPFLEDNPDVRIYAVA